MPAALAELAPILLALVALGLATLATVLVYALFHPFVSFLESIPGIGGLIAYPFKKAEQFLLTALAKAEAGVDHLIGIMFHLLAQQFNWLWREFKAHAAWFGPAALLILAAVNAIHHLRHLVHGGIADVRHFIGRVKTLEKEWHGIEHRVKTLERRIAHGIGHDLRIHIKALERWEDVAKGELAAAEKAFTQTIPAEIANLKQWLGIKPGTRYLDWVAALGLAALASLGLDFLKCDNAKSMSRNRGCSTWSALDDLLGLVALGIVAAEFETLIHEAQELTEGAVTVFDDVFGLSR